MDGISLGGWLLLAPLPAVEDAKIMMCRLGHTDALPLKLDRRPIGLSTVAVDEAETSVFLRRHKEVHSIVVIRQGRDWCLSRDDRPNLWRDREVHLFR